MKILTTHKSLSVCLDYVIGAIPPSTVDPILSHVLIRAESGVITMIGTNHQMQITATCKGEFKGKLECIVPADKLRRILGTFSDDAAIKMDFKDSEVSIAIDRSTFKLMTKKADQFTPLGDTGEMKNLEQIEGGEFLAALNIVQYAAAQDSHRRSLNGVLFQRESDSINFVGTDGHRMVVKKMPGKCKTTSSHIIPIKTIQALTKYISAEDGAVSIATNDRVVSFATEKFSLISNTIQENYPDYMHVIPLNNENQAVIEREPLRKALERVIALSSSSAVAYMEFAKDKLNISCNNSDNDSLQETLDVKHESEDITLVLNATYMMQFLNVCKDDMIQINMSSPENSVLIHPSEEANAVKYVVMPVRV